MGWDQIGQALGISRECARLDAIRAMNKIRRRAPWLAEVIASALRVRDFRSPAQQAIDAAPHSDDRLLLHRLYTRRRRAVKP